MTVDTTNPHGANRLPPTLFEARAVVGLRLSLAFIFLLFGAQKFTDAEAMGIVQYVANSPLTSWMTTFGYRTVGRFFGCAELSYGLLLAVGLWRPGSLAALMGALGSCVTYLVTLSFLLTTPSVFVPHQAPIFSEDGLFLFKDVVLLAVSVFLLANGVSARQRP